MAEKQIWRWHNWDDASGHLTAPDGKTFFIYDWSTKEYKNTPESKWDSFLDADRTRDTSLSAFKDYAQEYIRQNIVPDKNTEIVFESTYHTTEYDPIEAAEEAYNGTVFYSGLSDTEFSQGDAEKLVSYSERLHAAGERYPATFTTEQAETILKNIAEHNQTLSFASIFEDFAITTEDGYWEEITGEELAEKYLPAVQPHIDAPEWLSDTLLTDEEEKYIHSAAFKEKFGDWEKAVRLDKLRNSYPVVITGAEIAASNDIREFKKNAVAYGKTLTGTYKNRDTGNEILLTASKKNGGIYEILEHDYKDKEHLQSISAIPQIIEDGIYIASEKNKDKERHPNVSSYDYYVCGLRIGDEDYTVKSVISNIDGKRYYDHKLTAIEKGRVLDYLDKIESVQATSVSIATQTPEDERLQIKDIRLLQICQCPQKSFIDINQYDRSASAPTKAAVQAVRDGSLYREVDADGFEIIHDDKNGIIYGQELRNIVYEQLQKENKALKARIDERATVQVDGHECLCAHGLEQGAENAIRRVNALREENALLRKENRILAKENERLKNHLNQSKQREQSGVEY